MPTLKEIVFRILNKDGDAFVDPATEDTLAQKFGGVGFTNGAVEISDVGDNIIIQPESGNQLQIAWLALATSKDNSAETLARVFFAGGDDIYRWPLGTPGAFMRGNVLTGPASAALIINLSAAQPVQVNYAFKEV